MLLNHTAPLKEGTLQRNCQMPTASDYFPTPTSKYFRAGDFTKEIVGTIQSVDRAEFKNDDGSAAAKPVLHFQDLPQALVLNKTNFTALSMMFGEDTNDWTGEKVALYPSCVDFKGKTMPTIKVRRPQKAAAPASGAHPDVPF
jgi:hypothetical protein